MVAVLQTQPARRVCVRENVWSTRWRKRCAREGLTGGRPPVTERKTRQAFHGESAAMHGQHYYYVMDRRIAPYSLRGWLKG